jgi:REP element-mobilizing transposase RayT
LYFHIIFWTRKLQPALSREMLAGACEEMDQAMFPVESEALAAGGTESHLHILARISPDHSLQEVLYTLRKRLKTWVAKAGAKRSDPWHEDDVSVSMSPEDLDAAKAFIELQQSHHEIVTFQSEMKAIFDEHGFEYDERTLWG